MLALLDDKAFEVLDAERAGFFVLRQKAHGDRIIARRRQGDANRLGPIAIKRVGNLDQYARAVAQQRVSAHRAAMVKIEQNLQAAFDRIMGFHPLDIRNKANATSVMLIAHVIQSLIRRETHRSSPNCRQTARLERPD